LSGVGRPAGDLSPDTSGRPPSPEHPEVAVTEARDPGRPEAVESPARREPILVSACLLGVACNHRGGSSPSPAVAALAATHRLVPCCPEVAGGLGTPRAAAERRSDGRITTADGTDVTAAYGRGADHALALARAIGARTAVLKARSPSCGSGQIYDGTFSRRLIEGEGLTAERLRAAGIDVRSEEDLDGPAARVADTGR
jgi:uncharacterized protein YbbK (DUF523 family)